MTEPFSSDSPKGAHPPLGGPGFVLTTVAAVIMVSLLIWVMWPQNGEPPLKSGLAIDAALAPALNIAQAHESMPASGIPIPETHRMSSLVGSLEDMNREWIQVLQGETFAMSLARFSDGSELLNQMMSGDQVGMHPSGSSGLAMMAKTRRFAKAAYIARFDAERRAQILAELHASLEGHITTRNRVKTEVFELISKLDLSVPLDEITQNRIVTLMHGFYTFGPVPDGTIPASILGTQRGLMGTTMLLGVTEDPGAISSLILVADAIAADTFGTDLQEQWGQPIYPTFATVLDSYLVADALDRILMNPDTPYHEEYVVWRDSREFRPRAKLPIFPFDNARSPYDRAGALDGPGTSPIAPARFEYELGLSDSSPIESQGNLKPEDVQTIIEFGRRAMALLQTD